MGNNYNSNTVKSLNYFEHIRQYPGMYIGSKDTNGLHHLVKEIISNSIDEYLNGAGDTIIIKIQKDGGFYVEDNGRGIPIGEHSKGISTLQACYGVAHTGGKFDNATGATGYNTSGGEHGTGLKAVNALSTKLIATSSRDGMKETVQFSKGKFITSKKEKISSNIHGVTTLFYPDGSVLEETVFDSNRIKTMVQEFSFLCSGLKFIFEDEIKNIREEFLSEKGLYDFIEYLNKGKDFLFEPIYLRNQSGNFQVEAAIGYNEGYGNITKLYTNNIPQTKGTHLTGLKTALTTCLNQFAREKGWIKEKEENLTGGDYEEGQVLILNFKMIDPVFKGQNKEELSSSEGRVVVQQLISSSFKEYLTFHEKDIKIIIDRALSARRAREAAKKARDAAREIEKPKEKGFKAKATISSKFIDCADKNPSHRNLLLVEGLSAGSAAVEARNVKTDCIYMLRGKVISPLKTDISKILANQEMSDIIQIIGGGFGKDFNLSKVKVDKVVITADQDSDGDDIALLLMTFFFTYMRPLVEAGKLYRAVTPLYILRKGKEEKYFYSEKEMADWREQNQKGWDVLRAKGLGELNAADLHKVCFENQRFKRITISDAKKSTELLEILEGQSVEPRKKYIYDNATELGFNFD